MKEERKRKRVEQTDDGRRTIKSKGRDEVAVEKVAAPPIPSPTEEEVDEFFAILRRMRVAVKYFEKGTGLGGGDRRLQDPVEAAADMSKAGGTRVVEDSTRLDLNAVPESETS